MLVRLSVMLVIVLVVMLVIVIVLMGVIVLVLVSAPAAPVRLVRVAMIVMLAVPVIVAAFEMGFGVSGMTVKIVVVRVEIVVGHGHSL